jgi:hypothetical protein
LQLFCEVNMPRVKTKLPVQPSREKGQRSLDDAYINRYIPVWAQPYWKEATFWRQVVANIPAAIDCREYIISHISSLNWKIEPRISTQRDELKDSITYHTELFESGGWYDESGWDYLKMIEWGLADALDTPFGMGFEVIREGDKPDGKVLFIIPIDAATLKPTLDKDWPVAQQMMSNPTKIVVFPAHAINRFYYSPRTDYKHEGWGMPPPEKIFLALEMIRRGDVYFAKFLSDTPEAGILDLINMEEGSAIAWIEGFKNLFTGIDPMKIPVLYQHDQPAKWIPFGKDPNALQFDTTYSKYVTLACAGYGVSPTDIGFPSKGGGGGETLSGSIRDERRTKRTGIARTKKGLQYWFNRLLPKDLRYTWVDVDDEVSVAISRARLAGATAASQYIDKRIFTPKEMRLQTIADGLITISVPEEINTVLSELEENELDYWVKWHNQALWGDLVDLPELTLSTIQLSQKAVYQVVNSENWLAVPTTEITKAVNDLVDMFESDYVSRKVAESERMYESGKSKTYLTVEDVEVPVDAVKQFKSLVRKEIRQILSELDISKSLIAGIRNAIIKTGFVELLDSSGFLHDNVITYVRAELAKLYLNKLNEFEEKLDQILEEDLNGKSNGNEKES